MLASSGYTVVEANSGAEAVAILVSGERVDVMLVDIAMPGMDGIHSARRAREQRPDLLVLFATGYTHVVPVSEGNIDLNCMGAAKPTSAALRNSGGVGC
jgi:CheY-like chemotaxis protein